MAMFKHKRTTLERIDKFISPLYFKEVNLYGQLYGESCELDTLEHLSCGQERPSFTEIIQNPNKYGKFSPASIKQAFGPTWSTHWFKVKLTIPNKWKGKEVHLRWDASSEALIWSEDGLPLQGLSGAVHERTDFVLTFSAKESISVVLYIEMACNDAFGAGENGMINPPETNKSFTLKTAEIVIFNRKVYSLLLGLKCLHDFAAELPETNPRSFDALYAGNDMINAMQGSPGDEGKEAALKISNHFFSQKNGATQHQIIAVGHCHIDCAWLWPYDETIRKCARSWSSTLQLMERYPNFKFACSQAQQFEWVRDHYPKLYEKLKNAVAKNRFLPVGGTWVEMDGNLPSGESFVRQFLYGQRFFQEEFGKVCSEFWLPDTFGYSPQLPQIMKESGITRFLTQKLSWSLINKFPHHNFLWEGIDGTAVLSHFPPGDSYEMKVEVKEALKQVSNLQDKGRVSQSLMLFGYGDGGGGPTEDMIERQRLLEDVDGLPKIKMGDPTEVFQHLESNLDKLCTWRGELYLELHNGTYTSQALMKELNRKCEFLLRDLEFFVSIARSEKRVNEALEINNDILPIWKKVLLNQFHDVLPGSSIEIVHKDALDLYQSCIGKLELLIKKTLNCLGQINCSSLQESPKQLVAFNSLSWERMELVSIPAAAFSVYKRLNVPASNIQRINGGKDVLVPVSVKAMGYSPLTSSTDGLDFLNLEHQESNSYILKNKYLSATINNSGKISSFILADGNRKALASDGNNFVIFDDIPLYWDAWDVMDYHLETRKDAITKLVEEVKVVENGPLRISLKYVAKIGSASLLTQTISLDVTSPFLRFDTEVDWRESHKFLKVEFPVHVQSMNATYEIQFGHLERPTHYNTSWDWARFEVCGHKWMDLSEHGFGVSVLNTSKYGHSVHRNIMSLSLLRSPKKPDKNADMGLHKFSYAVMPHTSSFQSAGVVNKAYELNNPLRVHEVFGVEEKSFIQVSHPGVILETVKLAEDNINDLVLRLYESYGGHCETEITSVIPVSNVWICNVLEEAKDSSTDIMQCSFHPTVKINLAFKPFQIITLRMTLNCS